jgi:hypothetical protein
MYTLVIWTEKDHYYDEIGGFVTDNPSRTLSGESITEIYEKLESYLKKYDEYVDDKTFLEMVNGMGFGHYDSINPKYKSIYYARLLTDDDHIDHDFGELLDIYNRMIICDIKMHTKVTVGITNLRKHLRKKKDAAEKAKKEADAKRLLQISKIKDFSQYENCECCTPQCPCGDGICFCRSWTCIHDPRPHWDD